MADRRWHNSPDVGDALRTPVKRGVGVGAPSASELLAGEARRASDALADVQYGHTEGVIDLTWGHPDPSTFPTALIASATQEVLTRRGWQALSYGAPAGAAVVRSAVAEHLSSVDADVSPHAVLVTAGSSGGLDLVLSLLAVPGDVVVVEQPTYFLALRIFADHGLRVVGLADDEHGPLPADLARVASVAAHQGSRVFLYIIPTFANPTGRSLIRERRESLLATATASGVMVIEDDVYRDTAPSAPASMWSVDPAAVIRLGSFSKSLAPGLRVGYLTATPAVVDRIAGCGLLDSGGGSNHMAAMIVGELIGSRRFAEIVAANQARLRERRVALGAALSSPAMSFRVPHGGFFIWCRLHGALASNDVVAAARAEGVLVSDGRVFFAEPARSSPASTDQFVRLSFSMLDVDLLREGARRLVGVVEALTASG